MSSKSGDQQSLVKDQESLVKEEVNNLQWRLRWAENRKSEGGKSCVTLPAFTKPVSSGD